MRHDMRTAALVCALLVLVAVGCSGGGVDLKPEHQGAFYSVGGSLVQIPASGQFPYAVGPSDPVIEDLMVIYLLWQIPSLADLDLVRVPANQGVETRVVQRDDSVVEVTFPAGLDDGDYCLIVGDSMRSMEQLTRWCFTIGNRAAIAATDQAARAWVEATRQAREAKLSVAPVSEGVFLVQDDLTLMPLTDDGGSGGYMTGEEYESLPAVSGDSIVLVARHRSFEAYNRLTRGWVYPSHICCELTFDCELTQCTDPDCPPGGRATIVSIDGEQVTTCLSIKTITANMLPGTIVEAGVRQGTYSATVDLVLDIVDFQIRDAGSFDIEYREDYAVMTFPDTLEPGPYCLSHVFQGDLERFWFRVE